MSNNRLNKQANGLLFFMLFNGLLLISCDPKLQVDSSGSRLLYNYGSQRCLSRSGSNPNAVVQKTCTADLGELVDISEVDDRVYVIKSNNQCLEVAKGSKKDGAKIQFAACNNGENQKVTFHKSEKDNLFHRIEFAHSNKCLDILNNNRDEETALVQNSCRDDLSQDFFLGKKRVIAQELPKVIWAFWDKGADKMPPFYRANVKHWEEVLNANDQGGKWTIRILNALPDDPNYYGKFVNKDNLPSLDWIKTKLNEDELPQSWGGRGGKLNPAVIFSDFLRLELLYEHGGIWLDPSNILHESFDSLRSALQKLDGFNIAAFTSRNQATPDLRFADSFENFFIIAFPRLELVKEWKANFRRYWELKQPGMKIQDHPMYNGSEGDHVDVSKYGKLAEYLNQHAALKYTLIKKPQFLEQVLVLGDVSWAEKGPFTLLSLFEWKDERIVKLKGTEISSTLNDLNGVLFTKFPSENSREIMKQPEEYFHRDDSLIGLLNKQVSRPEGVKPIVTGTRVPKVVWGFWDKGEAALPPFNKYAVNHWRKLLEGSGYQIRILNLVDGDENNAIKVLDGKDLLSSNFDELDKVVKTYHGPDGGEVKMVKSVVQSDLIRLAILEKFGGVWMDTSNALLRNLDDIGVRALNMSNRSVAGYVMDNYSSNGSPVVDGVRVDGMENWFIVAKPESPLIKAWRKAFVTYWENRKPGQWISEDPMYGPTFDFGGLGISAPNYLNQHAALKYVLHHNPALGEEIYPVKALNPWWLHGRVGGDAHNLYLGLISKHKEEWARQIKDNKVGLLKFAGPHLTEIKEHFKTLDSYCHTPNLITILYGHCP